MSLWISVIHKPLIVKFYKSKYHSTVTKPLECFEPFSIGKQMFQCVLIIKNINFIFFFHAIFLVVKVHHSGRPQT